MISRITISAWLVSTLLSLQVYGQLVTTDPPFPQTDQLVTIIFDATQGSGGLAGYTGDVYAHTGVITQYSTNPSDWKYVKTNWGQNTPDTKMTRIGDDLYSLEITPNIRDYYGVPVDEKILQMAFVFRSATQVGGQWLEGKTATGGDIFVDVYEPGLNIAFQQPAVTPLVLVPGESFPVEVNASDADSLALFLNGEKLMVVDTTYLQDTLFASDYGNSWVKAVTYFEGETAADSFYFHVRKPVQVMDEPQGVRDGINYMDATTVVLSLLAPGKEFVFVMGDFNDWIVDSTYYMYKTSDGERFWLQINGLTPGKEYVFQYLIDGTIRVGDPYADKVSDPVNDLYISNTTYPDLITYPYGKTSGIATVLQTDQVPYDWEVNDFQPPAVTDLVIYELLVRDFTTEHSFSAVIGHLDYLQSQGINAVELMPVNEFEGNISWGYNPSFYFAPDKYYGPKDQLKKLVDECHKRGMAVFIDLVLNHAYNQCPFVQMYFDGTNPTPDNPWFNVHSNFTNPDAQWGNDFNHESPYTQALVDSINSYWMSEYKIDGFRFDFTKGFGNNIKGPDDPWGSLYDADRIRLLKRMSDEIWARKSDAIVIFEHLAENSEEMELANYGILLWGNMSGPYGEAAMGYHDSGKSNLKLISYKQRGWNDPHLVGYMESHDEERLMYKCLAYGNSNGDYNIKDTTTALQRMALDAVFFLTVPGPKMIWMFGEMGYDVSIDYNGRTGPKPVKWYYLDDERRRDLADVYKLLAQLREEEDAFRTDDFEITGVTEMKRIALNHESMNVIIIGNFGLEEASMNPLFQHTGTWYEYFTGDRLDVVNVDDFISLAAGEYRMYTDVRLGIDDLDKDNSGIGLNVFPNPSDIFTVEILSEKNDRAAIHIYDVAGTKVEDIPSFSLSRGQNTVTWKPEGFPSGIYLVEIVTSDSRKTGKIIIP